MNEISFLFTLTRNVQSTESNYRYKLTMVSAYASIMLRLILMLIYLAFLYIGINKSRNLDILFATSTSKVKSFRITNNRSFVCLVFSVPTH